MSEQEFTVHVRTNYDRWLRFARRHVGQQAEDVLQSVLLKLWAFHEGIDSGRADALVFTSLRHAIIDHWRKQAQQRERETGMKSEIDGRTPEQVLHDRDTAQSLRLRLEDAKGMLTPRERSAFAVWLALHPSREEASTLLKASKSAYSAAVHHALAKLTAALAPHQPMLLQVLADLGCPQTFAVLAEVFQEDLPETK